MARVRLVDVAQAVGVSAKTVSNVVNGTGWVSEAVRAQVLTAIEELGYRPNLAARQLRRGAGGLIGLGVPTLREPYFAELAASLMDRAHSRGLTLLVMQTHGERAAERTLLAGTGLPALDGLVLSPLALQPADLAARHPALPLVLLGEHAEGLLVGFTARDGGGRDSDARDGGGRDGGGAAGGVRAGGRGGRESARVNHVGPDNVAAAAAATSALLHQGRRRIAALGIQPGDHPTSQLRLAGYRRALTQAGIAVDPELLAPVTAYTRAAGAAALAELLDRGVQLDAVFCFSDTLAFGALHTLAQRGLTPAEVLVVGYDNLAESQFTVPPLSSVDPGVNAAGDLVLDLLTDPAAPAATEDAEQAAGGRCLTVPFQVVERW